jgi:hypothetical protein
LGFSLVVHLEFLNEEQKGRTILVRRFPFCAGRSPGTHLQLQAKGIWDQHLALTLDKDGGVRAVALPGALVLVNGEVVQEKVLSAGDVIGLGALQLGFSLSPAQPRGLELREFLFWVLVFLITGFEAGVLYWLLG